MPQVVERRLRAHDREVQVVPGTDLLDEPERLGEVVLRVEEHDLDVRDGLHRDVDEDAVLERRREHEAGPEAIGAHLTTDDAGFDSNERETSASSVSWGRRSTGVRVAQGLGRLGTRRRRRGECTRDGVPAHPRSCSCRALAVTHFGHVGAGLVEVDEELGVLLGRREDVEVLQQRTDAGRAAGPAEPVGERLARGALVGELADDRTTPSAAAFAGSFEAFSPNAISMLPMCPPSSIW